MDIALFTETPPRRVQLDDFCWPEMHQTELERRLRHGPQEQVVRSRMQSAEVVAAYQALIALPEGKRNAICAAMLRRS
jgi:hypothetical protein